MKKTGITGFLCEMDRVPSKEKKKQEGKEARVEREGGEDGGRKKRKKEFIA